MCFEVSEGISCRAGSGNVSAVSGLSLGATELTESACFTTIISTSVGFLFPVRFLLPVGFPFPVGILLPELRRNFGHPVLVS